MDSASAPMGVEGGEDDEVGGEQEGEGPRSDRRRARAAGANTSISEVCMVSVQYTYVEESLAASSSGLAALGKVVTL